MRTPSYLPIIIFLFLLSACERNVDLNLHTTDQVMVVDAQIENGKPPVIVLTKSFDYYKQMSADALIALFISNAVVTLSSAGQSITLKEYTIPTGGNRTLKYYSSDTSTRPIFTGVLNKSYSLSIQAEGKTYTGTTIIPALTKFPDSIWFIKAPYSDDSTNRIMMARVADPPGLGNYIRYFTKRNSEPFYPGLNSVFPDDVIDGFVYNIQVDPGRNRNDITADNQDKDNYFKKGDTVTVKLCNIDKSSYLFWSTWEFAQGSNGNPFSQPNKVIGNITNGALGAFYGYGAWYKTLIVK